MKLSFQRIILARKTAVVFTATALLIASQARAELPPPSVLNGLIYPTSAQRFFEAGERQLNEEVNRLFKQRLSAEKLLRISDEILTPEPPAQPLLEPSRDRQAPPAD